MPQLRIAQDAAADGLLSRDPLALLLGMLLDQQIPMEKAFRGPQVLAERLGALDAAAIASADPGALRAAVAGPPAVQRFPGSMAARLQALCGVLVERYGGSAEAVWTDPVDGADPDASEVLHRLTALPGFGDQKARIFLALLGKQCGVRPAGWREAAGPYGEDGVHRSVADVVDADSLERVRATKKAAKQSARAARD